MTVETVDEFIVAAARVGALPCPFCGAPASAGALYGVTEPRTPDLFHCSTERTGGFRGDCPGTKASAPLELWNRRP